MKAAVVTRPGELSVMDVPRPAIGEYGALCQLLYGATCTGTDGHLIACDPPFSKWLTPPFILGHESIGRVVEVGPKVRNLKTGDLVTRVGCPAVGEVGSGWGGFAEIGVALDWRAMREDGRPASEWKKATVNQLLPSGMDPAAATMVITWRETLSYLKRVGVAEGAAIAVLGSGGNGLSFLAHSTHLGAEHRVMVGSPLRAEAARRAGATGYVDYHAADAVEQALAMAPGGFDFVIDAVGKSVLADLGISILKPRGTFGTYGLDEASQIRINPALAKGSFIIDKSGYDEAETHDDVMELIRQGKLDASIWLDLKKPFALDDIGAAFDAVRRRKLIKALVRLSDRID